MYTIWYEKYDTGTRKIQNYFIPFSGSYREAEDMLTVVVSDPLVQRANISPSEVTKVKTNEDY